MSRTYGAHTDDDQLTAELSRRSSTSVVSATVKLIATTLPPISAVIVCHGRGL